MRTNIFIISILHAGFIVSVRRMIIMKNRPVDPGNIQGCHRPTLFKGKAWSQDTFDHKQMVFCPKDHLSPRWRMLQARSATPTAEWTRSYCLSCTGGNHTSHQRRRKAVPPLWWWFWKGIRVYRTASWRRQQEFLPQQRPIHDDDGCGQRRVGQLDRQGADSKTAERHEGLLEAKRAEDHCDQQK